MILVEIDLVLLRHSYFRADWRGVVLEVRDCILVCEKQKVAISEGIHKWLVNWEWVGWFDLLGSQRRARECVDVARAETRIHLYFDVPPSLAFLVRTDKSLLLEIYAVLVLKVLARLEVWVVLFDFVLNLDARHEREGSADFRLGFQVLCHVKRTGRH